MNEDENLPEDASTRVKPGGQNSGLFLADGTTAAEAHRRAPTLLAGAAAGQQGEVRVCAPEGRLVLRELGPSIVGPIIAIFLGVAVRFWGGKSPQFTCMAIVFFSLAGPACYQMFEALKRPFYLTTDDAGIGITTRTGTRALLWSEISKVELEGDVVRIQLHSGPRIELDLFAHPETNKQILKSLILRRANEAQGMLPGPGQIGPPSTPPAPGP